MNFNVCGHGNLFAYIQEIFENANMANCMNIINFKYVNTHTHSLVKEDIGDSCTHISDTL